MTKRPVIQVLLLVLATAVTHAEDFTYTTNNGAITITGYTGPGGDVTIPGEIAGLPVTRIDDSAFCWLSVANVAMPPTITEIGNWAFGYNPLTAVAIPGSVTRIGAHAFYACVHLTNVTLRPGLRRIDEAAFEWCTTLQSVTIPNGVTSIEAEAFSVCSVLATVTIPESVTNMGNYIFYNSPALQAVRFAGNAPVIGAEPFYSADAVTVYHLPGATGWGSTFAGRPTAPWHLPSPIILDLPPFFGIQTNHFAFRISWATNASVVVDASPSLSTPSWSPIATNSISMGSDPLTDGWSDFTDPAPATAPARFYRVRSP